MLRLLLTLLLTDPADVDALRSTAPAYLTHETARDHLVAARIAAHVTGTEPALLLSIAHHESRYTMATSPESGGRVSCGVMTPTPVARCVPRSLVESYLDGAQHLRGWFEACRGDRRCALLGYAGGYRLIRFCAAGGVARGCKAPQVFGARARWIERAGLRARQVLPRS